MKQQTLASDAITVAIIGFGRFGQLLTDILLKHTNHTLIIITKQEIKTWSKRIVITSHFELLKKAEVVFPCVPIRHFEETIEKISQHIQSNALVIDVCSVKVIPEKIMLEKLPAECSIISSHPMFGAASVETNQGLHGLKWVFWNTCCDPNLFNTWKWFLSELGFRMIEINPEDHDKLVAQSQAFTQLVGVVMNQLQLESTPIDTVWFESLLKIKHVVGSQNRELIEDMFHFNKESRLLLEQMSQSINKLLLEQRNTIQ